MNSDDFEKKLQQLPFRQVPADWRETILTTAHEQVSSAVSSPKAGLIRAMLIAWRELIHPCRFAWSGMAALWLIFWMVNAQTQLADSPSRTGTPPQVAAESIQSLKDQRRALVELTGLVDVRLSEPSRRSPKPRSERMLSIRNC